MQRKKNPGKNSLSVRLVIAGKPFHLNTEIFMLRAGIKMNQYPIPGGAPSLQTALLEAISIVRSDP